MESVSCSYRAGHSNLFISLLVFLLFRISTFDILKGNLVVSPRMREDCVQRDLVAFEFLKLGRGCIKQAHFSYIQDSTPVS
jgi:hypothetical protein